MTLNLIRRFSTRAVQKTGVLSEAERAVGYPTSFLSLRWILNDEVANIATHVRKLIGTEHPLLKTAKKLLLRNELTWGLVVLLITKTVGLNPNFQFDYLECDQTAGILHSQRVIAEVLEMIRTSNLIHKGLINLNEDHPNFADLHYGNKIALLGGDYLLSKSFHELAVLRNSEVQEMITISLRDLSEAQFIGPRDKQNRPLPSKPTPDQSSKTPTKNTVLDPYKIFEYMGNMKAEWILRNILDGGSLLASCCRCNMILAHHGVEIQNVAYNLGESFALLTQVASEKQAFENGEKFSLVSAPVMLHLQYDPSFYSEIEKGLTDVNLVDLDFIRKQILTGPALKKTEDLIEEYSQKTIGLLNNFEDCESKKALVNIIKSL